MPTSFHRTLILLCLFGFSYAASAQDSPCRRPVVHYKFDGGTTDHSGKGNRAMVSGAISSTDRHDQKHKAYRFDGRNDAIIIDGKGSFNTYTIAFWFSRTGLSEHSVMFSANRGSGSHGLPQIELDGSNTITARGNGWKLKSEHELTAIRWYHVALEVADDQVALYLNGVLQGRIRSSHNPLSLSQGSSDDQRLEIGARTASGQYFQGSIDDFYIFPCAVGKPKIVKLAAGAEPLSSPEIIENEEVPIQAEEEIVEEAPATLETLEVGQSLALRNVQFEPDQHELLSTSFSQLDEVAKFLKARPNVVVEIAGHTALKSNSGYNVTLSMRRAKSVAKYLESRGVSLKQMICKGYGSERPLIVKGSATQLASNRRVEIKVLKQ